MKAFGHLAVAFALSMPFLVAPHPVRAQQPALSLLTIPTKTFKVTSNAKERIESSVFFLVVETKGNAGVVPLELTLDYLSNGKRVRTEIRTAAELQAIDTTNYPPSRLTGSQPKQPVSWPHAFRIHVHAPAALGIDTIHASLRVEDGDGKSRIVRKTIPLTSYAQKARLIFPFRGPGLVTQGGALESSHRNRSGLYAVDAIGLSSTYGALAKPGDAVRNYAGWGREIIAPAAGRIVQARSDRPDQPKDGVSDPQYYAPEFPDGGDTGNFVVIDHGRGEFSMIAHLQRGSVQVAVGDEVTQGQVLGRLGNSGDSSGPHVHYQLQDGPRWEYSNALPAKFENVSQTARGSFFEAQ